MYNEMSLFHQIDNLIKQRLRVVMVLQNLAARRPVGHCVHAVLAVALERLGEALAMHAELRERVPLRWEALGGSRAG